MSSAQAQLVKNRQKYLSASHRQPNSSARVSSSTERSSEQETTRTRTRQQLPVPEESPIGNKPRSRLRRPGTSRRRITTTTTDAPLDDNNELPQVQDNGDDSVSDVLSILVVHSPGNDFITIAINQNFNCCFPNFIVSCK